VQTFVPHWSQWASSTDEYPNRFNMQNSYVKDYFEHYLGIEKKEQLKRLNGEEPVSKKEKKK